MWDMAVLTNAGGPSVLQLAAGSVVVGWEAPVDFSTTLPAASEWTPLRHTHRNILVAPVTSDVGVANAAAAP